MYKNALKGGIRTAKQAWKFRNGDYAQIFHWTILFSKHSVCITIHTYVVHTVISCSVRFHFIPHSHWQWVTLTACVVFFRHTREAASSCCPQYSFSISKIFKLDSNSMWVDIYQTSSSYVTELGKLNLDLAKANSDFEQHLCEGKHRTAAPVLPSPPAVNNINTLQKKCM